LTNSVSSALEHEAEELLPSIVLRLHVGQVPAQVDEHALAAEHLASGSAATAGRRPAAPSGLSIG
jgi:hypothetical protein